MEVNLNSVQSATPSSSQNLSGVAAPQTEAQRADQSAQRVTQSSGAQDLENKAASADERRFAAIKSVSSAYADGDNPLLKDIRFTVYKSLVSSDLSQYTIRFTNVDTGEIEVKSEADLFHKSGGGDVVSGNV